MRDSASFLNGTLSARNATEDLQLLLELIIRLYIDQIGGRPTVLGDQDGRLFMRQLS